MAEQGGDRAPSSGDGRDDAPAGVDRYAARRALASVAGELRQWVEWMEELGADELPAEEVPEAERVRSMARRARARRRSGAGSRTGVARPERGRAEEAPTSPSAHGAAGAEPASAGAASPAAASATSRSHAGADAAPAAGGSAAAAGAARESPARDGASASDPGAAQSVGDPVGGRFRRETLEDVRRDLGDCTRCALHEGRTNLVFGVGSPNARLILAGEAPGQNEDRLGEPFVGRAGRLLTRMLGAIGLRREEVYICNVLKCRPPNNRDPKPEEIATCSPFLARQLEAIGPDLLVTVGGVASKTILGLDAPIGKLRRERRSWRGVPVVATYHPAYLLRNPAMKSRAWDDLLRIRQILRERAEAEGRAE